MGSPFLVVFIFLFLLCLTLSPFPVLSLILFVAQKFSSLRYLYDTATNEYLHFSGKFSTSFGQFRFFSVFVGSMSAKIFMKSNKWTINSKPLTQKTYMKYTFLWRWIGHCVVEEARRQRTIAEWSIHIASQRNHHRPLHIISLAFCYFYFNSTLADQQRAYKLFQHFAFLFVVKRHKNAFPAFFSVVVCFIIIIFSLVCSTINRLLWTNVSFLSFRANLLIILIHSQLGFRILHKNESQRFKC